jgi:hypothetical protein
MQLKDIKVGMKVKIPDIESRSICPKGQYGALGRNKSLIKACGLSQDYLYVTKILDITERHDCVCLGAKPNYMGMGSYFPSDIEPYEGPKKEFFDKKILHEEVLKEFRGYPQPDSVKQNCIRIDEKDLKKLNRAFDSLNVHAWKSIFVEGLYVSKDALKTIKEILTKYGI